MSIFKVQRTVRSFFTGGKAFVRDGSTLYTAIQDSLVQTDLESGESRYFPVNEGDPIVVFTVSEDGKLALVATKSTLFFVFDLVDMRCTKSWKGYQGVPVELAIDPLNCVAATGYSDRSLRLWDLEHGMCLASIKGFNSFCSRLSFSPFDRESPKLFCGGSEGKLQVFQISTDGQYKQLLRKDDAHASAITGIRFSSCGRYFFTFSRDKIVTQRSLLDFSVRKSLLVNESVEDGELIMEKEDEHLTNGNFPTLMALGGERGSVSLWNFTSGTCLWREPEVKVENPQMITNLIFTQSSKLISFASDHSIRLFEYLNGQFQLDGTLNGHKEEITDLCVVDNLLVASTNSESVKIFDRDDLFHCQELKGHSEIILCLAVKKYASFVFLLSGSKDNSARLWCKKEGDETFRFLLEVAGHNAAVGAVAFTNDQNEIAFLTASQDLTIKYWRLQIDSAGDTLHEKLENAMQNSSEQFVLHSAYTTKAHDKDINSVAVSPNNKLVLTSSQDKAAKVWDCTDGSLIAELRGHKRGISCAIFHPSEKIIATCSADKSIKLWSGSDFSCIRTIEGHLFSILKVAFIKQGTELLSVASDGLLKIWSTATGECLATFDEHSDKVWAVAFSTDFSCMYTGGADSCIKEWLDVSEEEERRLDEARTASIDASQRLSNMLKRKDYKNAFFLAFQLGQPYKLFAILKELVTMEGFDVQLLGEIIALVPMEQLGVLLDYCKEWNTSFSKSFVAQLVLNVIFNKWNPKELMKIEGMDKKIEAFLPYTTKHVKKLDELYKSTYLVDLIV